MRNLRTYKGRRVAVSTVTGEYKGMLASAHVGGIELEGAVAIVNGQDVQLAPVVFIPAHQIVHVQVAL